MYNIKSFCVVILARSCLCQIIIIGTDEGCVLPIANPSSKELLEERPPSIYQYLFCWFGCPSHVCVLIILNGIKEIRTFAVIWLQTPYFLFSGDVAFTPALIQPWLCPHSHLAAWLLSSLSLCRFGSWCNRFWPQSEHLVLSNMVLDFDLINWLNVKVICDTTFLLRFRKEPNFGGDYLPRRHQCSWQGLAVVGDVKGGRCQRRSWWRTRWSRSWGCRTGCGRCCSWGRTRCRCLSSRHGNWSLYR